MTASRLFEKLLSLNLKVLDLLASIFFAIFVNLSLVTLLVEPGRAGILGRFDNKLLSKFDMEDGAAGLAGIILSACPGTKFIAALNIIVKIRVVSIGNNSKTKNVLKTFDNFKSK